MPPSAPAGARGLSLAGGAQRWT